MLGALGRFFGGYAWRQRDLRLLYMVIFLSFLGTSITFPLRMLYAQAHGATPAELGIMGASFLLAPLLAQVPLGWLVDHWGRVPVLLTMLIAHTITAFLYIPFNTPIDIIVLRFLEGLIVSGFQPAIGAYIADVAPEEHRSEAYGVLGATIGAGLLAGPVIGGIVAQAFGFVTAFVINVVLEGAAIPLVWGQVHEPAVHAEHRAERIRVPWRDLITLPLLGAYIAFFTSQVVGGMLTSLWAIWIHDIGGSYTYIGLTFAVFAVPQIVLGAIAGRVGDRLGRAPVLLVAALIAGPIYAVYGFITNQIAILVLGVIEGTAIVFFQPVVQGFLADASPPRARGRAQGVAGAFGAIGGASAAGLSLPLYHVNHSIPFVGTGVVMIAGSALAAAAAHLFLHGREGPIVDTVEMTG